MEPTFIDGIVARIRAKNREDYEQVVFLGITDLRIWIQENAEKAALAFLAVGFLIPFLFQFLLLMCGLAALVAFVVWTVALPGGALPGSYNSDDIAHGGSDQSAGESGWGAKADQPIKSHYSTPHGSQQQDSQLSSEGLATEQTTPRTESVHTEPETQHSQPDSAKGNSEDDSIHH
jgi:hypothetical protein